MQKKQKVNKLTFGFLQIFFWLSTLAKEASIITKQKGNVNFFLKVFILWNIKVEWELWAWQQWLKSFRSQAVVEQMGINNFNVNKKVVKLCHQIYKIVPIKENYNEFCVRARKTPSKDMTVNYRVGHFICPATCNCWGPPKVIYTPPYIFVKIVQFCTYWLRGR